jgi:RimJ/RimL family protein N-acetyltransferase
MIRIEFENLILELISENDLEQIRHWRNQEHVRSNMDHQELITSGEQKRWFDSLDKKKNLYFRIISKNEPIGVLNLKDINWDNGTAQAGIFVGEQKHLSTMMPIIAVFVLMKVCFDCFALKSLTAKIAKHNTNALRFNSQFGYIYSEVVKEGFDLFTCTKDSFYSTNGAIKKLHELFDKNGQILIRIDEKSKWLRSYIQPEGNNFHVIYS